MENKNLNQLLAKMDAAAKADNHQLAAAYAEQARRASPNYNPATATDLSQKGAPLTTRMFVGASADQDRLSNLRKHYPEAMPVGDDNYAFFDREEGRPTIYNPEGLLRMDTLTGDIAENLGVVPEMIGGGLAAAATSPTAITGAPIVAAGAGATAAGKLYDSAVVGALGGTDSRDAGEHLGDLAEDMVWNSLPIPEAAKKIGGKISPALRNWFATSSQAVNDVLNKYDIKPTAGVVGNKMLGALDAYQQKSIVTVDLWQKRYDEMLDGFGRMVDDFQGALGGRQTPTTAGMQLLDKGKKYQQQFMETSEILGKELSDLIPDGTMVNADETITLLRQYSDAFKNDPAFQKIIKDSLPQLLADAFDGQNGEISYQALSALRTRIGNMIKSNDTIGDVTQGELKQIYKAMTEDKFNAANSMGDVVGDLAQKFNDHYRTGMDIQETFITPYMMKNGKWVDPSEVHKRVSGLINKPQSAEALKKSGVLDEEDFAATASAYYDDIGKATSGNQNADGSQLSPSRVLAQSGKMSDEATDVFLNQDAKTILGDMRTFAENTRDVERMVNNSNSGSFVQAGEGLAAGGSVLVSAAQGDPMPALMGTGALLVNYLSAKGIQSNMFTNWLRGAPNGGSREAQKEWLKAGKRIAVNNGVQNVFEAWTDGFADVSKNENRGVLAE